MHHRWLAVALVSFTPSLALAADDCPAGSTMKTEEGFSWCQPSVCLNDGNCGPSEVCRPIPLCVEVGKLNDKQDAKDAAQRLVATQRCAPDESCPSTQTCSKMSRCIGKAAAEKMGLLANAEPTNAPEPAPKKSSCGCAIVGARTLGADALGLAGVGLALAAIGSRRIHRGARAARRTR